MNQAIGVKKSRQVKHFLHTTNSGNDIGELRFVNLRVEKVTQVRRIVS